jgi:competence protein ComEC
MLRWIPYAVVRIVVFFMAGIVLGIYLPDFIPQQYLQIIFAVALLAYIVCFILQRFYKSLLFNPGFLGLMIVFLSGYLRLLQCTDARQPENLIHHHEPVLYYQVTITNQARSKENAWKAEGYISTAQTAAGWKTCTGNLILYFPKSDFRKPFQYGDILLVKGMPQAVPSPGNPGEFDYKKFLAYRKIYHQQFVRQQDVKYIGSNPSSFIVYHAICARAWADTTLARFVEGKREQAIASALVLGVTDGLDNELLNAYAATGAMHVLAVSGLHISIIYMLIIGLLRPLNNTPSGRWWLAAISLVILWGYAFVTGLSPSVLRAVTMFTFMAIAKAWNRQTNIYNTLAASAFCLLIYEPYLIMSVAFQLSYLAVLGIVYLQPGIYNLWEPSSRFWDEVWKITCVSVAAQLATFSLGLLYFHQFPNYFLISNLLVIPISFAVLILGLAVLAVSFIGPLALLCGWLLLWSIKALNVVVFTVESFPYSLIDQVYIDTSQSWLLMIAIVCCVLLLQFRKFYYFPVACVIMVMFVLLQWTHHSDVTDHATLALYRVPHHTALDLIDKGRAYFIADSSLQRKTSAVRFHIQPNRLNRGVDEVEALTKCLSGAYGSWRWQGRSILMIRHPHAIPLIRMKADYLIISNNAVKNLSALSHINASEIILDSSNSYYFAERLRAQASVAGIRIYSVLHEGAFIRDI